MMWGRSKRQQGSPTAADGGCAARFDLSQRAARTPLPSCIEGESRRNAYVFRTLVVPLDGSAVAEHALPRALAIARRAGATVRLAYIHSLPGTLWEPWQNIPAGDPLERWRKEEYLDDVARRIHTTHRGPITTMLIEGRQIAEALCSAAAGAQLVVMATRGRGWLGGWWRDDTANRLMRRLPCPLLAVPGYRAPVDLTGDPVARHIMIPLDGSPSGLRVLGPAAGLGRLSDARLTLVSIQSHRALDAGRRHAAGAYLRGAVDRLDDRIRSVRAQIVSSDARADKTMLALADQRNADMVALVTRGRRGWERLARPSVAEAVVHKSGLPVLVLRRAEIAE